MDFRQLAEIFGGSIFPDDYRTDLRDVQRKIGLLDSDRLPRHVAAKSWVFLLRSIRSAMGGNFTVAERFLAKVSAMADAENDASLLYRCCMYRYFFRCLQRVPPYLRFRFDFDTDLGVIKDMEFTLQKDEFHFARKDWLLSGEHPKVERFESDMIGIYGGLHYALWREAFDAHPDFGSDSKIKLFQEGRKFAWEMHDRVERLGISGITCYLNKVSLEYRLAGRTATEELVKAYYDSLEEEDLIQAANYKLIEGDRILSPPFTSPLALNIITTVGELGWENPKWDKKEVDFTLRRNQNAMSCYDQALFLFEAASARRGMAAVLMRYACVDIAEAIWQDSTSRQVDDLLQSALCHLNEAQSKIQGDVTNTIIVSGLLLTHSIMFFDINNLDSVVDRAYEIGILGTRTQNFSTAEFVGTLLLRLGRRLALLNDKRAFLFCAGSRACFRALNDDLLELHAVVASAKLQEMNGDIPVSAKHISYGRKLLEGVVKHFDSLKALYQTSAGLEKRQLDHNLTMIESIRTSYVNHFGRAASAVYSTNQAALTNAAAETDQLLGASPLAALLQTLPIGDPMLDQIRNALLPGANALHSLRRAFNVGIDKRHDELVLHADIDAAEQHLREVLDQLEDFPGPGLSVAVESLKVTTLHYLGEYERAREIIPNIIHVEFTGTRQGVQVPEGTPRQLAEIFGGKEREYASTALSMCFIAKDWARGMEVLIILCNDFTSIVEDMLNSKDRDAWQEVMWMATIMERRGGPDLAFKFFIRAFEMIEANRQRLADMRDRRDVFSSLHAGELFQGLSRVALQLSETPKPIEDLPEWSLTSPQWRNQALRFLELGRSRTLLDMLVVAGKLQHDDLREWSEYSYQLRLNEVLNQGTQTPKNDFTLESRKAYLERAKAELQQDIEPKSPLKLLPEAQSVISSNEELYRCIPEDALVVHINVGREGLLIMCISTLGIVHVYQSDMTDMEIGRHILRFARLMRNLSTATKFPPLEECDRHLRPVSDAIIQPIEHLLKDKDHIIFVPSYSLNKFPLSALSYNANPLFISKDVSQIPSLSTLPYLVGKLRTENLKVGVVLKDPREDKELAISATAAIQIAHRFGSKPCLANGLALEKFTHLYETSDVVLIATHGEQHKSAWESSLLLPFPFRVLELARLHTQASLVVFEACVSGLGEETLGNDLLGFSHAVLASGASAFLGGLWRVSDEASALLMSFFFTELGYGKSLARCWRNAQRKLYDLDKEQAIQALRAMAKAVEGVDPALATTLRRTVKFVIEDYEEEGVNFKNPFFWAPFVLVGNGGYIL